MGDVHGCYDELVALLGELGYVVSQLAGEPEGVCDMSVSDGTGTPRKIVFVGDLVDRGPQSEAVLDWLARPWFFAVCGNHDYMAWRTATGNPFAHVDHLRHGGEWVLKLAPARRRHAGSQ